MYMDYLKLICCTLIVFIFETVSTTFLLEVFDAAIMWDRLDTPLEELSIRNDKHVYNNVPQVPNRGVLQTDQAHKVVIIWLIVPRARTQRCQNITYK